MATTTKKSRSTKAKKTTVKSKKRPTKKVSSSNTAKNVTKVKAVKTDKKVIKSVKNYKDRTVFEKLNIWNWVLAVLHAGQAIAVLVLSANALFPVTTNYLTTDTLAGGDGAPTLVLAQRNLFDINLAYIVSAFFIMSAIAHLAIATVYRVKYESDLSGGLNKARWFEYGLSASTMMVGIAILSGVSDLSTLVLIFGGTLVMNLLGLVMEIHNKTTKNTNWLSFIVGTIAGILPWLVVGIYLFGANKYGAGEIPAFVYYIYGSMFVLFSSFAVNMYFQYKKTGRWQDYLYGERVYMVLSLVAKSALAWQVFFGSLRP